MTAHEAKQSLLESLKFYFDEMADFFGDSNLGKKQIKECNNFEWEKILSFE